MYPFAPYCHSPAADSLLSAFLCYFHRQVIFLALAGCLVPVFPASVHAHGDLHEQIQAVSILIEKMPSAELHLIRGELHRAHREYDEALADFDRAEALDTEIDAVHLARGCTLVEAGKYMEAEKALSRFLNEQPGHPAGYLYRARAVVALKQFDRSVADYDQAIGLAEVPKPDHYIERAEVLKRAGKLPEALVGLEQGIARLGALVTLEIMALEIEMELKRHDAALVRVERLIASAQRKERWQERKAAILSKAGRKAEAKQSYEVALKSVEELPQRLRSIRASQETEKRIR
ncbi:MAG: tetratricopeptide repeat protein, partial [Verrucomicrobiaceae bacterium]